MSNGNEDTILIAGEIDSPSQPGRKERGFGGESRAATVNPVRVDELRRNVDTFFHQLSEILETDRERIGGFQIDHVEISAQITGEGKLCLLGSGTKVGVGGGLKFVLKRR